ncbi:nucleolar protein dao-5-like isoform X2 [Lytechinus variegatus]|uniref:nucleolar protein dao-5-like isoform X2 n=1 Tax=Lytechinus variegatus TaxID=7654 RepID=UPI001BB1E612|nr:nucleolar protein dao-5-like isoform X2 [Lytechinus variegatus]
MATLTGSAAPWTSMPLPHGWEAKYEPNIGRYFYINHMTKKTQWVDPRKEYYEAQQRSPAQPRAYIPMQPIVKPKCRTCKTKEVDVEGSTCNACKVTEQQREIALMRAREQMEAEKKRQEQQAKLEKERERRRVQSAQRRQEAKPTPPVVETTFNEPPIDKEAVKREMRHMFANTQANVVDMILETYDFNKDEAKTALGLMGQKVVNQPVAKKASPRSSPKKSAPMTAMKKQTVKANLKKKFPNVSEMMIEMAVDSTNYDEAKASAVLHMLKSDSSSTQKGGASRKEVTFPESRPSSSTSTVTSRSTTAPSTSDSQKRPTTSAAVSSPSKKPAAVGSPSKKFTAGASSSMATKKPATSKSAMPSKKTPSGPKKQAYSSPVKSNYPVYSPPSSHTSTTEAKGPDPSLVQGPDRNNLLQDYMQNMGPNPEYLAGPNKENIIGPVEKTGRDPTLVAGPDQNNCNGPEPNLAKGSMYTRTSGPLSTEL